MAEEIHFTPDDDLSEEDLEVKRQVVAFMKAANIKDEIETTTIANEIVTKWPERSEGYALMAVLSFYWNNYVKAAELMEQAFQRDPDIRDYANALSAIYTKMGRLTDGLYYAKLSVALDPHPLANPFFPREITDYAAALVQVKPLEEYKKAVEHFTKRDYDRAIEYAKRHLQVHPNEIDAYILLADSYIALNRFEEARPPLHAAIHLKPNDAHILLREGITLIGTGRVQEGVAAFKMAKAMAPEDRYIHDTALRYLNHADPGDWPLYLKWTTEWSRAHPVARKPRIPKSRGPVSNRKIRVGFISNDFRSCTTASFLEPILRYRNRQRFHVVGYQTFPVDDSKTTMFQHLADDWSNLYDVDDKTALFIMKNDELDILVDLTSYGENGRLDLMNMRPAAHQVAWTRDLEPGPSPCHNWIFTDEIQAVHDRKVLSRNQKSILIQPGLVASMPFNKPVTDSEPPARNNGYITFGGFMDPHRFSTETLSSWVNILSRVENAKLILAHQTPMSEQAVENIVERFASFGLSGRVSVHDDDGRWTSASVDWAYIQEIDVFLDTHPVSSYASVPAFLWAGVPFVTRLGERRGSNLAASMLYSAKQSRWIANDEQEYIDIAVELARNVDALANTRTALSAKVVETNLFQPTRQVAAIENAFVAIMGA